MLIVLIRIVCLVFVFLFSSCLFENLYTSDIGNIDKAIPIRVDEEIPASIQAGSTNYYTLDSLNPASYRINLKHTESNYFRNINVSVFSQELSNNQLNDIGYFSNGCIYFDSGTFSRIIIRLTWLPEFPNKSNAGHINYSLSCSALTKTVLPLKSSVVQPEFFSSWLWHPGIEKSGQNNIPEYEKYDQILYVSHSGNSDNPGSRDFPVASIQTAVLLAQSENVLIMVEKGIYKPGDGLEKDDTALLIERGNLVLSGGWGPGFNQKDGFSELDGNYQSHTIIKAAGNISNLIIEGFVIRNSIKGAWGGVEDGGGIAFSEVSYSLISNVIISNNSALNYGGGFYDAGGSEGNNTIYAIISGNKAGYLTGGGGGIFINSDFNKIFGIISNNTAVSTAGGGIYSYHNYNEYYALIMDNTAKFGGGLFLNGDNNLISGLVYRNTSTEGGGGGLFINGNKCTIDADVAENISFNSGTYAGGGGIYIVASQSNSITLNGNVYQNISTNSGNAGGGIYVSIFAGASLTTNGKGTISDNQPDNFYIRP